MSQKIIQGQATAAIEIDKKIAELHQKFDSGYIDLSNKFDNLSTRIQYLEGRRVLSPTPTYTSQPSSKAVQNPKEYASTNSITIMTTEAVLAAQPTPISVSEDSETLEEEVLNYVEKPVVATTKETTLVPPPYKPPLPFPGRFKKILIKKYETLLDEQLKDLENTMPLMDCLALILDSHKHTRDMITERIKEVQGMVVMSHEDSDTQEGEVLNCVQESVAEKKLVQEKLEDPGSFTLPCNIGESVFDNCLCDL